VTRATPSWEELNAYVDGELSPDDAAVVARALAEDRALAQQVAMLTKLKAVTHGGVEAAELPTLSLPRRRKTWVAVAASLAAVLLVAIITLHEWNAGRTPAWVAQAWQAHRQWVAHDRNGMNAALPPSLVLARLSRLGSGVEVPDLSAAQLTLNYMGPFEFPRAGIHGVQLGYVGTRGCHLSLMVFPAPQGGGTGEVEYTDGTGRAYSWQVGSLAYALFAVGMDDMHLALIARTVRNATLEHKPLGAEAQTALRHSRIVSRPCAA
jgi:anti-sigma factor RsiW